MAVRWLIELLGFPDPRTWVRSRPAVPRPTWWASARRGSTPAEKLGIDAGVTASGPCPSRASTPARRHTTSSRAPWACWAWVERTCGWSTWTRNGAPTCASCAPSSARMSPPGARPWPSWATPATSTPASSTRCRRWPRSPASTTSGSTSMAPTAASGCSTSGSRRPTATAPRTTRSRSTRTSGWPCPWAPVWPSAATGSCSAAPSPSSPGTTTASVAARWMTAAMCESPWSSLGSGTPDWGVDFSTPARGIAVWAVLKEMGAAGMRERVRRHNDFARLVAERARSRGRAGAAVRAAAVHLLLPLPAARLGGPRAHRRA